MSRASAIVSHCWHPSTMSTEGLVSYSRLLFSGRWIQWRGYLRVPSAIAMVEFTPLSIPAPVRQFPQTSDLRHRACRRWQLPTQALRASLSPLHSSRYPRRIPKARYASALLRIVGSCPLIFSEYPYLPRQFSPATRTNRKVRGHFIPVGGLLAAVNNATFADPITENLASGQSRFPRDDLLHTTSTHKPVEAGDITSRKNNVHLNI
jgi:hypothetical protein